MSEQTDKTQYRVRNWRKYDAALKKRGSLTFWVDDDVLSGWLNDQKTGKRGASATYSDSAISTHNVSDDEAFEDVLDGIEAPIKAVSADGADDKRKCYDALAQRGAQANIPPSEDAQYWQKEGETHARNQNLKRIDEVGRAAWKRESGYHRRSLAETMMFRFKAIFGNTCSRRTFDNQAAELLLAYAALNRMTHLGMPDSYALND